MRTKAPLKKFDSLQAFRGLAAIGVVVHHSANSTVAFISPMPSWLYRVFDFGFLGVDFFFVLSGFIIMSSHFDDTKTPAALKSYGFKRFIRIFPPYWPVSLALMVAYFFLPYVSHAERGNFSVLSSLLLLPDAAPPALAVAWTLIHEVMFYLIFSLFFISSRLFVIFLSGWAAAICIASWSSTMGGLNPFLQRFLDPINLEFFMGMGVAYFARGTKARSGAAYIFIGAATFIALLLWPFSVECRALFGIPFSALVLGAIILERHNNLAFPRWMVTLGDASYSIYLVHSPLLSVSSRLVARMGRLSTWGAGMLVGVISSVVIGLMYHLFIEKPLIRIFRRSSKENGRQLAIRR